MTDQNTYAIYALCGIIITLYALKNEHTHYLPDLFALALALTSAHQWYGILAVGICFLIRHSPLAYSVADLLPEWIVPIALPAAKYMSSEEVAAIAAEQAFKSRISEPETESGNAEGSQPVAEIGEEIIFSATCKFAAKTVYSGVIKIGEATAIASGVKSGRRYQTYNRRIKLEIAALEQHYSDLDSNKQQILPPPN